MESSGSELQLTGLRSSPAAAMDRLPTSDTHSLYVKNKWWCNSGTSRHLVLLLQKPPSSVCLKTIFQSQECNSWVESYLFCCSETFITGKHTLSDTHTQPTRRSSDGLRGAYLWCLRISRHSTAIPNTVAPAGMTRPVADCSWNSFSPLFRTTKTCF